MKLSYRNQKNAEIVSKYFGKPLNSPDWYEIKSLSSDQDEILIYDYIGWPYNDPYNLVNHLRSISENDITVRIASPGGDVFDGITIFNAFKNHKGKVTTRVESLAASMASVITMAGDEVQSYSNSMLMIHNSWCCVAGNRHELAEVADVLTKIDSNMLDIYKAKTKATKKEISEIMDNETYLTAKEAREKGFIDTILESGKAAKAKFDTSIFSGIPDGMLEGRTDREFTVREIERILRDGGVSNKKAKAILAGCKEIGGISGEEDPPAAKDTKPYTAELQKLIQKIKG